MTERISDIFPFRGMVPPGIFNIMIQQGGIPERGPGSHSVPNALEKERRHALEEQWRQRGLSIRTLEERRAWNSNNQLFSRRK